jgi:hypothetical protein
MAIPTSIATSATSSDTVDILNGSLADDGATMRFSAVTLEIAARIAAPRSPTNSYRDDRDDIRVIEYKHGQFHTPNDDGQDDRREDGQCKLKQPA